MFRRRCLVRIHQQDGPTVEGILVRRRPDYRVVDAKLIEGEDRTLPLDGQGAEIPRERVVLVQLLAKAA